MKTIRRVLAVAAVVVTAAPAFAQPGMAPGEDDEVPPMAPPVAQPQPPPPPSGTIVTIQPDNPQQAPVRAIVAPMNEDWSNVSHINGQIVKVGERSDYLIDFKKTNISSNPIGWMLGFYGLSVSHAVSQNIAIRADGNIFDFDDDGGYEVGLTLPIYFKRVYQGPFLEGGVMVRSINDDDCDWDNNCMDTTKIGPQVMFGWHWTFDSGMNVAAAFGAFRPMNEDKTRDDVEPAGYFRIGYAY
jgi:hypothetical protein